MAPSPRKRSSPLPGRSASFHGKSTPAPPPHQSLRRPKTLPDLASGGPVAFSGGGGGGEEMRRVPAKVLVNVTVQRSIGAVQVMASTDWTVEELVAAAIRQYAKEGRRAPLPSADPAAFGLHYSRFSLQCLDPKEKLVGLGSRNFFLCPKPAAAAGSDAAATASSSPVLCSKEAEKQTKTGGVPWLRFMDFLLKI